MEFAGGTDVTTLNTELNELSDLILKGRQQGFLTYEDVTKLLPDEAVGSEKLDMILTQICLLYTSPSPRDATLSRMPSSA